MSGLTISRTMQVIRRVLIWDLLDCVAGAKATAVELGAEGAHGDTWQAIAADDLADRIERMLKHNT